MILIEPPRSTTAARRDPLNKRELGRFAALAVRSAGATDDERLRELNRQFRKKNAPTDVLSFPPWGLECGGPRSRSAGDLAISLDTAARQAESFGHSLAAEVKVLILHGALHLAGFDHETDSGEMAALEARLRKKFGLPSGLIQRASSATPFLKKRGQSASKVPAKAASGAATAKKRSRA